MIHQTVRSGHFDGDDSAPVRAGLPDRYPLRPFAAEINVNQPRIGRNVAVFFLRRSGPVGKQADRIRAQAPAVRAARQRDRIRPVAARLAVAYADVFRAGVVVAPLSAVYRVLHRPSGAQERHDVGPVRKKIGSLRQGVRRARIKDHPRRDPEDQVKNPFSGCVEPRKLKIGDLRLAAVDDLKKTLRIGVQRHADRLAVKRDRLRERTAHDIGLALEIGVHRRAECLDARKIQWRAARPDRMDDPLRLLAKCKLGNILYRVPDRIAEIPCVVVVI